MITIELQAQSGKEKQVSQFVAVLYLPFNGIASASLLLGIVKCLPITKLLCTNRIDIHLLYLFLYIRF